MSGGSSRKEARVSPNASYRTHRTAASSLLHRTVPLMLLLTMRLTRTHRAAADQRRDLITDLDGLLHPAWPQASLSLSADIHLNALINSYDCVYL
jgi:hypothetical protein